MKIIFLIDWSYSVGKDGIVLCCSITARYIIISRKYQNDNSIMLYKQLSIFSLSFYTTNCNLHFFAKLYIYPIDLADPDRLKLKLWKISFQEPCEVKHARCSQETTEDSGTSLYHLSRNFQRSHGCLMLRFCERTLNMCLEDAKIG